MVDTVIVIQNPVNEKAMDVRMGGSPSATATTTYVAVPFDPNASYSLGGAIRTGLSLGNRYGVEVCDFGCAVSVRVTYSDAYTAKAATATFLVIFDSKKGNGTVRSSARKYRTVGNYQDAISYIRACAGALQNKVSGD